MFKVIVEHAKALAIDIIIFIIIVIIENTAGRQKSWFQKHLNNRDLYSYSRKKCQK